MRMNIEKNARKLARTYDWCLITEKQEVVYQDVMRRGGFMKKFVLFAFAIFIFFAGQTGAQSQMSSIQKPKARPNVAYPEAPRVSAYEAYLKFKTGKAIIIHAGGAQYKNMHILGALEISQVLVCSGKIKLPKFPRRGIEIFTYCY